MVREIVTVKFES